VLKVNDRYRIEKITYKVVQSTLVRAEGVFTKQGDNFVLPLKEIDYQADETIPLHLTIVALDTITKKVKTFNMEAPFRILADDGFIEHEISKTTSLLSQGSDNPDTEILGRMAKLSVYSDYGMNIYSLALWAVK
jgi:hypothetical protein